MPSPSERLEILDRLEKGEITTEDAARLLSEDSQAATPASETPMGVLEQLERGEIDPEQAAVRISSQTKSRQEESEEPVQKVKVIHTKRTFDPSRTWGWVAIPIALGTIFAVLAGLWMAADVRDGSLGFGFLCAWFPLAIGVLLILLGWFARRGPWADVKVKSHKANGHVKFFMDAPVPVGMAGRALRFVGDRVPGLAQEDVDKLMDALQQAGQRGQPINIQANSDDGEDIIDISIS